MLVALDVHYDELTLTGTAAAVVFADWADGVAAAEYKTVCGGIAPYAPGEFYRRELPCLLEVLALVREPIDAIVIDGYVSLGDKPGLGTHLHDALQRKAPIIGVAKTRFHAAGAVEVLRGGSNAPLFVTTVNYDPMLAAEHIRAMHGPYRIPTSLKRVDRLSRS
jgi:deoxyribonuclease V